MSSNEALTKAQNLYDYIVTRYPTELPPFNPNHVIAYGNDIINYDGGKVKMKIFARWTWYKGDFDMFDHEQVWIYNQLYYEHTHVEVFGEPFDVSEFKQP